MKIKIYREKQITLAQAVLGIKFTVGGQFIIIIL